MGYVLPAVPSKGFFNVLGDDHFTLFLNGEKLFHQAGFVVHKIDAKKLKAGKNVISAIIKNDKDIAAKFKNDPVTTVEGLIGIDLPNDQIEKIIDGIKAKIALDKIDLDNIGLEKVGNVLGGLFGKK